MTRIPAAPTVVLRDPVKAKFRACWMNCQPPWFWVVVPVGARSVGVAIGAVDQDRAGVGERRRAGRVDSLLIGRIRLQLTGWE